MNRIAACIITLGLALPAIAQQNAIVQNAEWQKHRAAALQSLRDGDFPQAEAQLQATLQEAQKLGPWNVFRSLLDLALLNERQGQYAQAEALCARAVSAREMAGPAQADLAAALEIYARVLRKLSREKEAEEKASRAEMIRAAYFQEKWGEPPEAPARPRGGAGAGVAAPHLLQRADPEYSEDARLLRHEGVVELRIEVRPDGRAHNIRLKRGLGLGLDEKAAEAVSQWRFQPAIVDGQPVTVEALITVHFRLL